MIRIATENDAEKLLEIYAYYVKNTAITFEYEVPSLDEFKKRIHKTKRNILANINMRALYTKEVQYGG